MIFFLDVTSAAAEQPNANEARWWKKKKKNNPTGVGAGLLFIPNESLSLTSLSCLEPFAIHTSPTAAQGPLFFLYFFSLTRHIKKRQILRLFFITPKRPRHPATASSQCRSPSAMRSISPPTLRRHRILLMSLAVRAALYQMVTSARLTRLMHKGRKRKKKKK